MRRRWPTPSILVVVGLLVAVTGGLNGHGRWARAEHTAYVRNDGAPLVLRVVDLWTGEPIATVASLPGPVQRIFTARSAEWWTPEDGVASDRRHDFLVQVMGDGCEVLATMETEGEWSYSVIESANSIYMEAAEGPGRVHGGGEIRRPGSAPAAAPATDPCGGAEPVARGTIVNRTLAPAVVGPGVVVAACSQRVFHPGDMAEDRVPEARPAGAFTVRIPSIEAQDEWWPDRPRAVVITAADVIDDRWIDRLDDMEPCAGVPPDGPTAGG